MKSPQVGMKIDDCYMHGVGDLDDINCSGVVEAVGIDWMVVRNQDRQHPIFVKSNSYELH